jgi:hypothetical protein
VLGQRGEAAAGENGCLVIAYWDETNNRPRVAVGYVGERGIEAHVVYRVDGDGKFVRVRSLPQEVRAGGAGEGAEGSEAAGQGRE